MASDPQSPTGEIRRHTHPSSAIFPVLQLLLMRSLTGRGREARLDVSLIIETGLSLPLEDSGSLRSLSGCEREMVLLARILAKNKTLQFPSHPF